MIEILIKLVCAVFLMAFALVIGFGLWRLIEFPIRRGRESVFDYVYVDDQGRARELDDDEKEFVTCTIIPDETNLYIKPEYQSRRSDGRLSGYLRRRQLPRNVSVGPAPSDAVPGS